MAMAMVARRIFPVVGKLGSPGTKVPKWGPGIEPRWGSGSFESLKAYRQIVKIIHK